MSVDTKLAPTSLEAALEHAETHQIGDAVVQMAESVPDGDLVAVRLNELVLLRRKNKRTGWNGSEMGSGEWLEETCVSQWRPI